MSAVEKARRDLESLNKFIEEVDNGTGDANYLEKAYQAKEEILEKFPSLIHQYTQAKPSRKRYFEETEDEILLPKQKSSELYAPPPPPSQYYPLANPIYSQYYPPAEQVYSHYQPTAPARPQYYQPAAALPQPIQPALGRQESIIGRPADTKFLDCVRNVVRQTSIIVGYILNNFGLPEADIKSLRDYSNFNRGIVGNAGDDEIFADAIKFLKDILNRVKNNCDRKIVTEYTKTKYINATNGIIFYSFSYKLDENNFSEINRLYIEFDELYTKSLKDDAAKNYLDYIVKILGNLPKYS